MSRYVDTRLHSRFAPRDISRTPLSDALRFKCNCVPYCATLLRYKSFDIKSVNYFRIPLMILMDLFLLLQFTLDAIFNESSAFQSKSRLKIKSRVLISLIVCNGPYTLTALRKEKVLQKEKETFRSTYVVIKCKIIF